MTIPQHLQVLTASSRRLPRLDQASEPLLIMFGNGVSGPQLLEAAEDMKHLRLACR